MKISNPISRNHLHIKKSDKVLDIGGGDFPHPRANVVVDKFVGNNTHRGTDASVYSNQEFIQADAENLPFKDNEFDYVISTHVLEHVENPAKFIQEMCRVGKRGYLETPSVLGEFLIPKQSHRLVLLEIDNKLVIYEKDKINFNSKFDYGEVFLGYFPRQSIGWKIMQRTHYPIVHVRIEWQDSIDFAINPEDERYLSYFTKPWNSEMVDNILPQRSFLQEAVISMKACADIGRNLLKARLNKKSKREVSIQQT